MRYITDSAHYQQHQQQRTVQLHIAIALAIARCIKGGQYTAYRHSSAAKNATIQVGDIV